MGQLISFILPIRECRSYRRWCHKHDSDWITFEWHDYIKWLASVAYQKSESYRAHIGDIKNSKTLKCSLLQMTKSHNKKCNG